jgi:hypothetical protein
VTHLDAYPAYLRKDVQADGKLHTYANGEINYTLKGVHAKVSVLWDFEAPAGGGDTHYSVMRGTRANLVIRQGAAEAYQPVLTIEPVVEGDDAAFVRVLEQSLPRVQEKYPGVDVKRHGGGWEVTVPAPYHAATKPISAGHGEVPATSRTGRCRRGKSPTCWPSTTRRRGRWRSRGPDPGRGAWRRRRAGAGIVTCAGR